MKSYTRVLRLKPETTWQVAAYGNAAGRHGLCTAFVRRVLKLKQNPKKIRVTLSAEPIEGAKKIFVRNLFEWGYTANTVCNVEGLRGIYSMAYEAIKLVLGAEKLDGEKAHPIYVLIVKI